MQDEMEKKLKSHRLRNIAILVIVALLAVSAVWGLSLRSSKDAGGAAPGSGTPTDGKAGTVTISITCQELSEDMSQLTEESVRDYIPEDGWILNDTEYDYAEGETVFDCLMNVCNSQKIHLDSKKDSVYGTYVKGIGYLYEFHAGKNSGWMFKVNGESPNYGCDKCKLTDGDKIEWYYVTKYSD